MNKSMVVLCVCAAALVAHSAAEAASVQCIGTESGGWGGPLVSTYAYEVNLLPTETMNAFDVGDHTGQAPGIYAVNVAGQPIPGWAGAPNQKGSELDADVKTPHGLISPGPFGACPNITLWTGPPLVGGGPYFFGHSSMLHSHDVGWTVMGPGTKEIWALPVGTGAGPVHAPIPEPVTLTLLALGGAVLVVRKRR